MVVGIPIDIRKQLSFSADSSLGNFASAITIAYKYNPKKRLLAKCYSYKEENQI